MTEARITNAILTYLRKIPGSWWYKVHGGPYAQRGVPDILGCIDLNAECRCGALAYYGQFFAFEVKRPEKKGNTTVWQRKTIEAIRVTGAIVHVVTSVDDVEELLRPVLAAGDLPKRRGKPTAAPALEQSPGSGARSTPGGPSTAAPGRKRSSGTGSSRRGSKPSGNAAPPKPC